MNLWGIQLTAQAEREACEDPHGKKDHGKIKEPNESQCWGVRQGRATQ